MYQNDNNNNNSNYYNQGPQDPYCNQGQQDPIGYEPYEPISKNLSDRSRMGFIRKVYSILSVQLLLTVAFSAASMYFHKFNQWQAENLWVFAITIPLTFISMYALYCYPKVARSTPGNYIWLFIFTICESWSISMICAFTDPVDVFIALALTSAIVVGLTIYAFTTSTDFTACYAFMFALSLCMLVGAILTIFIHNAFMVIAISFGCAVIASIWLIYDTQLIVGKHAHKWQIDDYILAALSLYIDIIRIFIEILRIISIINGDN